MKKIFTLLVFLGIFSFGLFAQDRNIVSPKGTIQVQNHSFLTEENVGSKIEIKGLLSVKNNSFVLKENPDSRSVVTFNLEVKKWGLKRKLKKRDGKTVKVSGELLEATSTWTKKMKVLSVE